MKLLILALSMVLATAAAHAQTAQNDASLLKEGESLVTRDCARCHGVGRTDASRHPQAPPFRTLSKRYPIESLEEALGEGIISGHPDMPEFQFDSDEVGAIVAYLKSIQER
jgi:mono/diheme cytochrome c family protein